MQLIALLPKYCHNPSPSTKSISKVQFQFYFELRIYGDILYLQSMVTAHSRENSCTVVVYVSHPPWSVFSSLLNTPSSRHSSSTQPHITTSPSLCPTSWVSTFLIGKNWSIFNILKHVLELYSVGCKWHFHFHSNLESSNKWVWLSDCGVSDGLIDFFHLLPSSLVAWKSAETGFVVPINFRNIAKNRLDAKYQCIWSSLS